MRESSLGLDLRRSPSSLIEKLPRHTRARVAQRFPGRMAGRDPRKAERLLAISEGAPTNSLTPGAVGRGGGGAWFAQRKRPRSFLNVAFINAGNDLLSHTLSRAVQSALRGLTSVFGMGTGGSPAVRSPTSRSRQLSAVSFQQMLR